MLYPNIEFERIKNRLTRKALAEKLGVSVRTYSRWLEQGAIPAGALVKLAKITAQSIDYLLKGTP